MKFRFLLLCMILLILPGCSAQNEEPAVKSFVLSEEDEEALLTVVEDTMNSLYWLYDDKSVLFSEQAVPAKADPNAEAVFLASEDSGYDLRKYAGKTLVVATADMLHFNGDSAGIAYFYFNRRNLVGLYYTVPGNSGKYYGIKNRNVFIGDVSFQSYEGDAPAAACTERTSNFPEEGFCALGKNKNGDVLAAVIRENRILVYRYRNGFSLYRTLGFSGKQPISAVFYDAGKQDGDHLAVIVGSTVTEGEGEGETTFAVSEEVAFFDGNMNRTSETIPLSSRFYSSIAADGESLLLMNDTIIEYYCQAESGNETFEKKSQFFMDHGATAVHLADLDGDGVFEYMMTDGMDLYIYHKTDTSFQCLWKTHLSIENLDNHIYTADLNQDGVLETYIADVTGTTIRYILTENGLASKNEDIGYGQRYFAGDFNGDGKDDYILISDIENKEQKLFLAQ